MSTAGMTPKQWHELGAAGQARRIRWLERECNINQDDPDLERERAQLQEIADRINSKIAARPRPTHL